MPHECRPCCLQRTRTTHRVAPSLHFPDARCTPPQALRYARALARPAASTPPCVLSPDPVTTPGCPVPGGC
eukprot:5860331-Prymnesium_polylepis.1